MTVDQVAERVALDCWIATEAPDVAATLLWRVKAAVDRLGKRGLLTASGKPARSRQKVGILRTREPFEWRRR
jgi:hypothetical protein